MVHRLRFRELAEVRPHPVLRQLRRLLEPQHLPLAQRPLGALPLVADFAKQRPGRGQEGPFARETTFFPSPQAAHPQVHSPAENHHEAVEEHPREPALDWAVPPPLPVLPLFGLTMLGPRRVGQLVGPLRVVVALPLFAPLEHVQRFAALAR